MGLIRIVTRIIAIGFITLILLGNYWFVLVITKQATPLWLLDAFGFVSLLVLGGGVLLAAAKIWHRKSAGNDHDNP